MPKNHQLINSIYTTFDFWKKFDVIIWFHQKIILSKTTADLFVWIWFSENALRKSYFRKFWKILIRNWIWFLIWFQSKNGLLFQNFVDRSYEVNLHDRDRTKFCKKSKNHHNPKKDNQSKKQISYQKLYERCGRLFTKICDLLKLYF